MRLFGVRLTDGNFIKKSASMGNLSHYHSNSSAATSPNNNNNNSPSSDPLHLVDGYLSDDPNHASCSSNRRLERKKGPSFVFRCFCYYDYLDHNFFFSFSGIFWLYFLICLVLVITFVFFFMGFGNFNLFDNGIGNTANLCDVGFEQVDIV